MMSECILEKILREKYKGPCPICGMGVCKELTDYSGYEKLYCKPRLELVAKDGVTISNDPASETKP